MRDGVLRGQFRFEDGNIFLEQPEGSDLEEEVIGLLSLERQEMGHHVLDH